jgi:hypothetical protein
MTIDIYLYQNYLIEKVTKLELKLLNLDESYRLYCNEYHDSIKMEIYSNLIESKKYVRLNKKINLYQMELELIRDIIKVVEPKCEYMELMEEQM